MKNVALITGASSGIGKELAYIHAERKGDLVVVARRKEVLNTLKDELKKKYNVNVYVLTKDLSDPKAPQEIYDELKKAEIKIDYLINNAGFGGCGAFHEREWKKDQSMMQVNMMALIEMCRLFLPDFVSRGAGKILNVSSTASFVPGPLQAVYYATKAYVQSFSNAISQELSGTGVTVTNLMPGATATEFGKLSGMDKTDFFKVTASAQGVAVDGYQGMMKGRLDVVSGLTFGQKIIFKLIPFIPKRIILRQIYKAQNVKL